MRTRLHSIIGSIVVTVLAACGDSSSSGRVDVVLDVITRDGAGDASDDVPNAGPPSIAIIAPTPGEAVPSVVTVTGTAADDRGVASVAVSIGPNVPVQATSADGFRTWSATGLAPAGDFVISAVALDVGGLVGDAATVSVSHASDAPDVDPPRVSITSPADGAAVDHLQVAVVGTASDDRGVVGMTVMLDGVVVDERPVETEDNFAHWARLVTLSPAVDNVITVTARDGLDQIGSASITLRGPSILDHEPPMLTVATPHDGDSITTDVLDISGTAGDNVAIRSVRIKVAADVPGSPVADLPFGNWTDAASDDGFATWHASVPVLPGDIVVEVRAFDTSGVATAIHLHLTNSFVSEWSDEASYALRLHDADPPTRASIGLTRDGVNAIMDEDLQKDITLLEMDPTGLLVGTLDQLVSACGTRWQEDDPDPHHDCSQTALGQTFVGPDGTWKTSPEYSLVRLLTMTPANVKVDGTSVEGLKDIADGAILGLTIGGGFSQILAETLGIERTSPIIPIASVAAGLKDSLVASHPFVAAHGGKVPVTLYDVMHDLEPLGAALGPVGDHPGVLDPSFTPHGELLLPDFEMRLVGTSNLRWLDGADLSGTKDYMAVLDDRVGPAFDDVIELDFEDPASFDLVGIAERSTIDLRIRVVEDPTFVPSCSGDDACKADLPATPVGASVWATPPWELEHGVALSGYYQYQTRRFDKCYLGVAVCLARVSVGQGDDPAGWIHFGVTGDLGNPPEDQYLWELISEVAQVALHRLSDDTTIAEGDADVGFTLHDVDVGLSADDVRAAVRPYLQAQKHELGQRLFGNYQRNNGAVDFVYRRGADGTPMLWFVAPGDPIPFPPGGYAYATPGFFADAALTTKLSASDVPGSGDASHEKLALATDSTTTVYVRDDSGAVYRVRVDVPADPSEITIHVARRMH